MFALAPFGRAVLAEELLFLDSALVGRLPGAGRVLEGVRAVVLGTGALLRTVDVANLPLIDRDCDDAVELGPGVRLPETAARTVSRDVADVTVEPDDVDDTLPAWLVAPDRVDGTETLLRDAAAGSCPRVAVERSWRPAALADPGAPARALPTRAMRGASGMGLIVALTSSA